MVQDPITGEWREAYESEGGYIPDPGGDVLPPDVPEGIPGVGVPYRDFIPQIPMVQDPATAEWRNAEPGEIDKGQSGDPNTPPEYGSQEVSPLQFGNTANLQTAGEGGDEGPPPPASPGGEGEEEYSPQEVPPLQFGNTANLESAQDPLQFGNTANLEFGPGTETEFTPAVQQSAAASAAGDLPDPEPIQTLDPALFDPSAPGPTLDPSLFDPAAPGPTLDPALLDPTAPGATLDPALLDPTAPGETIDPALLDPMAHGSTLDPYLLEQSVVEPGGVADPYLTAYPADPGLAEPYTADQDVQDQGFEDY
jgi:hypothetical protein